MIRRPVSRVLSPGSDPGRRSFICDRACARPGATYPDSMRRRTCSRSCGLSLFGLAPGGACLAPFLAVGAVRSYRTVSPLPGPKARRSVLCCAFPGVTPAGRYPAPCLRGARTFLDNTVSGPVAATAQPPDRDLDRPDGAERQASRTGQRLATAATAAIRPRVSSSRTPSQQAGRQRRWNASTTASMPASNE